ncbi:hypothetical protein [Amycolatopsis nigrescens]|uniref:hypothetical protein n=1 Tax=Amycolatopsis nigrescens TaxID=381445 RepID=UPI0003676666|nr:hypothetical protein [Amycolatopsis nigrescens]
MSRALVRVVLAELMDTGDGVPLGRNLRDAGVEVVYAGRLRTVEQLAGIVDQEDPDVLGVAVDEHDLAAAVVDRLPGLPVFGFGAADPESPFAMSFPSAPDPELVTDWVLRAASHSVEARPDRAR